MANASVVYADGSVMDVNTGLYNHHLLLIDTTKSPPTIAKCPNGKGVEPPGMSMWAGSLEDKGGAMFTTDDGQFNTVSPFINNMYITNMQFRDIMLAKTTKSS